jgi:hypothetical protein
MIQSTNPKQLYEQDILLRVEDTVAKLRAGDFANLDMEQLFEKLRVVNLKYGDKNRPR